MNFYRCCTTVVALFMGLALLSTAKAQNPFEGAGQYPQFREISGLSGGGYGVTFDGYGSLSGVTAFSTPIGYTLGRDEVRLSGGDTFFDNEFRLAFNNEGDATGKAFFTYGHTFGNIALTYTYMVKSYAGDETTNLQLAYVPSNDTQPGFSVGVQDIVGNGGAAGQGIPGDSASSQSLFVASTYGIQDVLPNTLYITAGVGTHRYSSGFASSSYQVTGPVRVWLEYDGFGFNEGILLTARQFNQEGSRGLEGNLLLGFIDSHYPTAQLTFGF